jgi:hypothetical protein
MIPYTYNFDYYVGDTYPIVIYDGGEEKIPLFVALASSGLKSYISTDSIIWNVATLPISSDFRNVVYGNGRFVAPSYGPTTQVVVYSSIDENNILYWTRGTMPVANNWASLAYGNNVFVAVARSSGTPAPAAISTNGITWTRSTMPSSAGEQWKITYGDEIFVAIINYSVTAVSTNGITWTTGNIPTGFWQDVAYGNNVFVAINGYPGNRSAYSTNGLTWTQVTLPITRAWRSINYANNIFIGAAIGSSTSQIVTSTNGITWAIRTLPTAQVWWEATYGINTFIILGASTNAKSTDGVTWTVLERFGGVLDSNAQAIAFADASYPRNIKYSFNKTSLFTVATERGNPSAEIFSVPLTTSYPEYRLVAEITPQLGSLLTGASYVYDIEVSDNDETYTLLTGNITTQQDVRSN